MGEFGDKFRKAREARSISLDDVSNVTKISARNLKAIEDEQFDQLPGGVFNKGFIRAYARHLGLNDEEAVTDYLACLRQAQIDANNAPDPHLPPQPVVPALSPGVLAGTVKPNLKQRPAPPGEELPELQLPRAEHIRPPRPLLAEKRESIVPWRILALVGLVIMLGLVLWNRRLHRTGAAVAPPAAAVSASPSTPPLAAKANPLSASQPAKAAPHPGTPNSSPPQTAPSAKAIHPPALAPVIPSGVTPQNSTTIQSTKVTPPSSATPSPSLMLVIRATETSWISITADGKSISEETLIAPAHFSVKARREIIARVGNAAGVTFLWNGQEIPAQGGEAETKTFVFDASGMRVQNP